MREEVYMAGMGGQGVLLAGQTLAQAAMMVGLEVSCLPLYSPEVRGGRATCTVVIANDQVGSPVVGHPATMILMDKIAVDNHLNKLRPDGLVVVNSSLAGEEFDRADITTITIPANDIAIDVGSERAVNMVLLGSYTAMTELVSLADIEQALREVIPERHHALMPVNIAALHQGAQAAMKAISLTR